MGLSVARVPRPPTSRKYFSSSPVSPWHEAQRWTNTGLPSTAVPRPGGRPAPSGGIVRSHALISSAVGARPTPYVGSCAATGHAQATRATIVAASGRRLDMDVRHATIRVHLPALDGVQMELGLDAPHLHELLEGRLDVTGLVGTPRLYDCFAPVPSPWQAEPGMRERQHGLLQRGVAPRLAGIGGDFHTADATAAAPRQAGDLVGARAGHLLTAGREGDHRLRFHDEHEASRLAVGHEPGVVHALDAGHVRPIGGGEASEPLDADVALPARHDEAQGIAVLWPDRLAVLTVRDQDVVHRLGEREAPLVAGAVGALCDDPRGALAHADLTQQQGKR